MIIPISIDDQDVVTLHKKINRVQSNVSSSDVRTQISDLLEKYAKYDLLEEVFEELT